MDNKMISNIIRKISLPVIGVLLFVCILTSGGCKQSNPATTIQVSPTGINQGGGGLSYVANPLPAWTAGQFGSVQLSASGGTPPYVWAVTAGTLPGGFNLTPAGVLAGTPELLSGGTTKLITPPFTVTVTDITGRTQQVELRVTIIQPTPQVFNLAVNVNPPNGGDFTQSLSPDTAGYHEGDMVMLTAFAADGWTFVSWASNDINIFNPAATTIRFNMPGNDVNIVANFVRVNRLTVIVDPPEGGSVGRDPNQDSFRTGDPVHLTANFNPGWQFDKWVSADVNIDDESNTELNFNMPERDTTVTAKFTRGYTLTVIIDPMGGGSVGVDPAADGFKYKADQEIKLTAQEWPGYKFDRWESADIVFFNDSDTNKELAITMPNKDMTVIAHFKEKAPETFTGEVSTIMGTYSASNGCGWEQWVCGTLTITIEADGSISAEFSGDIEAYVNASPDSEYVTCNDFSLGEEFGGVLSDTGAGISGVIMDTRVRPLGIDITAVRNGDQITATLNITKVMEVVVDGVVESHPALATSVTVTLTKQQ
jgi:hypothetical protein